MAAKKNTPKTRPKPQLRLLPQPEVTSAETDAQIVMKASTAMLESLFDFTAHFSPQIATQIGEHVSKMRQLLWIERDQIGRCNTPHPRLQLVIDNSAGTVEDTVHSALVRLEEAKVAAARL